MRSFIANTLLVIIVFSYLTFIPILFGIILSFAAYFLIKSEVIRFHLIQMGILSMTFYLLSIIFLGSGIIFWNVLVLLPYILIFVILALIEIFFLIKNKKIKLPLFGEIAENLMKGNV